MCFGFGLQVRKWQHDPEMALMYDTPGKVFPPPKVKQAVSAGKEKAKNKRMGTEAKDTLNSDSEDSDSSESDSSDSDDSNVVSPILKTSDLTKKTTSHSNNISEENENPSKTQNRSLEDWNYQFYYTNGRFEPRRKLRSYSSEDSDSDNDEEQDDHHRVSRQVTRSRVNQAEHWTDLDQTPMGTCGACRYPKQWTKLVFGCRCSFCSL